MPVMLPGQQMMAGYHGIVRLLPRCPPWDVLGTEEDVAVSSEENQASPQVPHLLLSVLITDTTAALSATVSPICLSLGAILSRHCSGHSYCDHSPPDEKTPHSHDPDASVHIMMVAAGGVRTTPDIMPRSFHDGRNVAVRLNSSVQMECIFLTTWNHLPQECPAWSHNTACMLQLANQGQ